MAGELRHVKLAEDKTGLTDDLIASVKTDVDNLITCYVGSEFSLPLLS